MAGLLRQLASTFLAVALLATATAAAAGAESEASFGYEREPARTLLGSAQYQGQTAGDFALSGALVINFILRLTGATEPESFDDWIALLPADGPYEYKTVLTPEHADVLDWLVEHYSLGSAVTREDMLKFGASILAFFVGLDAASRNERVPSVDPGPPPTTTMTTTTDPPITTTTVAPATTTTIPIPTTTMHTCAMLPIPDADCSLDTWKAASTEPFVELYRNRYTSSLFGWDCTDSSAAWFADLATLRPSLGVHPFGETFDVVLALEDTWCENPSFATGAVAWEGIETLAVALWGDGVRWWLLEAQRDLGHHAGAAEMVSEHHVGCELITGDGLMPVRPNYSAEMAAVAAHPLCSGALATPALQAQLDGLIAQLAQAVVSYADLQRNGAPAHVHDDRLAEILAVSPELALIKTSLSPATWAESGGCDQVALAFAAAEVAASSIKFYMAAQFVLDLLTQLQQACLSSDPDIADVYVIVASNAGLAVFDLLFVTASLTGA